MADPVASNQQKVPAKTPFLTLDGWAVAVALLLVVLVRLGVLKHITW